MLKAFSWDADFCAKWFYGKKKKKKKKTRKIWKRTLFVTVNRLSRNKKWCDDGVDNHNYICHICAKGLFRFWTVTKRLLTKYQFYTKLLQSLHTHTHKIVILGHHKKNKQTNKQTNKNKNLFYRRTNPPSRVGRSSVFFFFFLVALKTDPKKHENFNNKKMHIFAEKNWENILTYFQFSTISAKIFRFWSKNGWFYKSLAKIHKKICQNGKSGSVTPVKQGLALVWPCLGKL